MIKSFNVPFVLISMFGSLLIISSPNPMIMWVGMEVSSFFFIPLLQVLSVGAWKYFLTQGLSSFFLFLGFVTGEGSSLDKVLVTLSLSIKLGFFPFFGWMVHISSNVSWQNFFLLGSIQKLPPLLFMAKNSELLNFLAFSLVILSMVVLMFFLLSNYSIRWMMMFSSVFNMSWLSLSALVGMESLGYFLMIYFLLNFVILFLISKEENSSFSSCFKIGDGENLFFVMGFFFFMGLPPAGTFIGKMEVLGSMIEMGNLFPCLVVIFLSSVVTFFYLKVCLGKSLFSPNFNLTMKTHKAGVWLVFLLLPFILLWSF